MTIIAKTINETKTMTKRNLWKSLNNPDRLIENIITPIMNMLLFVFVLGGSLSSTTGTNYVNYIVPGVLLLCIGQCCTSTAISISTDIHKGIIDRFRSMPISTSSIMNGLVLESVLRTIISTCVMLLVALIIGFRPEATFSGWLLTMVLLLLYSLMITWFSILYGLVIKGPEGAGSFTMVIVVLTYLTSGFISPATLPTVLKVFAENQPINSIVEALRVLLSGNHLDNNFLIAVSWCLFLMIILMFLSFKLFNVKVR